MVSRHSQKSSLSAFIDEKFILEDGLCCLPFGHFEVPDIFVFGAVVGDYDWAEHSDPEQETLTNNSNFSSPNWSRMIRDFNVSTPARVLSLKHSDAAENFIGAHEYITLFPYSESFFSTPDL